MRAKPRRPAAIVPRLISVSTLDRPITEDPAGCPNRPTILFVVGDPDTTSGTGETGDGLRSEVRVFRNFETPNFGSRLSRTFRDVRFGLTNHYILMLAD